MKNKITILPSVRVLKTVLFWVATGMVSVALMIMIMAQVPVVQNVVKDQVLETTLEKTGQRIQIENVQVKWFDQIVLKNLQIDDYEGNTLLKAAEFEANYSLSDLFQANQLFLDDIRLFDGEINFVKYKDSLNINIVEFIAAIKALKDSPQVADSLKQPLKITVTQIELEKFKVGYDNRQRVPAPQGFVDVGHFDFMINQAGFYKFEMKKDTISTLVSYMIGEELKNDFHVREFKSHFRLTDKEIVFEDLFLKTPHSVVGDEFRFMYQELSDLSAFASKVSMGLSLKQSKIDQYDLSFFAKVPREHHMINLDADIRGSVADLSFRNLYATYNNNSFIRGRVDFLGLPKINEAFIDATVSEGEIYPGDFSSYLGEFEDNLNMLGQIRFSGSFLGFINDFVANADFDTDRGRVFSDINLKFPLGFTDAKYSGRLMLNQFDVGAFIRKKDLIQYVNLDGQIDGQGFGIDKADFQLNADITNTGIMGYSYDYIKADGRFAASYFRGSLEVEDPHCMIVGEGTLNLGVTPEEIAVNGKVDQLNLLPLGFSNQDIGIKTAISSNFKGLNLDSLVGQIQLDSTYISYRDRSILLDTVSLVAERDEDTRSILLDLGEARLNMDGDFYFSQLISDADIITREFISYFEPELERRVRIYNEVEEPGSYEVNFSLSYDDINDYLVFFDEDLSISRGGFVEGNYYQRNDATLFLYTEIDSIQYHGVTFYDNIVDINTSKDMDSLGVLANVYLSSAKQKWRQIPETTDMSLEAIWFNNNIEIQGRVKQPQNESSAVVNAEMQLLQHRLVFQFKPSKMVVFGDQWFFNPFNSIEVFDKSTTVNKLELYNGQQSVSLQGVFSERNRTDLLLDFKQFDLFSISPVVPVSLDGTLTSQVRLTKNKDEENYQMLTELDLRKFIFDDLLVGDIYGSSDWVTGLRAITMDFVVQREAIRTITLEGQYYPYEESNQLDVAVAFDQANVKLFEPFFRSLFSEIEGSASGSVKITGTPFYPIINGSSKVEKGHFRFDYLGTDYSYDGNINFDNETISLDELEIKDRDGDRARLNGKVRHRGFKNFDLNLDLQADNFLFLNTSNKDNDLYYGTAKGTGDIKVTGPVSNLLIKAKATTEAGTRIFIPLEDDTEVGQKDYISFVDLSDTTNVGVTMEQVRQSIKGITLEFELDITNRAYLELIRDIKTGDIIRGRGVGNLNMTMDTQGEFQLFGDITISEGGYNFTIPNFINKEFDISPGSTISWYGDPYQGILDLSAVYRQMASLIDYTPQGDDFDTAPGQHQRLPFLVILDLTGEMLSPEIDFKIEIDEGNAQLLMADQVAISDINNDEQELKRQVFSLLILRKFSIQDGFSIGGGAVGSSLSEFLSNQFSYFISQVDENLEVDIDLSSFTDANAFNTFQLRLAYTFLDGRLRVSGGGLVAQGNSSVANDNFFGDWSVRYILTQDGHLRIKAFSQTRQQAATNNSANFFRETGVSFQYVNSFNEFSDLLNKSRDLVVDESVDSPMTVPQSQDSVSISTRL